jgi:hypothetical protein
MQIAKQDNCRILMRGSNNNTMKIVFIGSPAEFIIAPAGFNYCNRSSMGMASR